MVHNIPARSQRSRQSNSAVDAAQAVQQELIYSLGVDFYRLLIGPLSNLTFQE